MNRTRRSAFSILGVVALSLFAFTAFGQATLTLTFEEMDPHVGQAFELRIVDAASGQEIDWLSQSEIPSSRFDLEIAGIPLGASYRIDYYADVNGNGRYDAPVSYTHLRAHET